MTGNATFDYIVIGAGSAGCVLANRLTEDGDASVLLLEAGGWDRDPMIRIPLGWGKILEQRRHDWGYFTEPEPRLEDRRIETARGKVIGGSSSINAMAYVRGNRADYDRWRQMGLAGWSHDDVLPYFKRSEAWEGGADEHRGDGGPLRTRLSVYRDPLVEAYLEAAQAAGYPVVADYNGASQDGFARIQQTIADGRRWSAAVAYLRPALRRTNLRVETGALTSRIAIEGGRAASVEYLRGGRRLEARAEREVIVSGGTINSPQSLMRSGVGDAAHLESVGIEPVVDRPQVGENLQDHLSAIVEYERPAPGPFRDRMRIDRLGADMARAWLFGRGPATDLPGAFLAFLKTRPELEMPDVQFLFRLLPGATWPWCPASAGLGATASPAARSCCAPKAAAPSGWPRRTPPPRSASGRTSSTARTTSARCATASASPARSRRNPPSTASAAPRPRPARKSAATRRSTPISAPPPPPRTTRPAPAGWASTATPSSTPSSRSSAWTGCGWWTPR